MSASDNVKPPKTSETSCSKCKVKKPCNLLFDGTPELPFGWKRVDKDVLCADCHKAAYVLRAVTIPVAGPVAEEGESQKDAWARLRAELHEAFSATTTISNWVTRELAIQEPPRRATDVKMAKFNDIGTALYQGARKLAPKLFSSSTATLTKQIAQKYKEARWDTIWLCSKSLPNYRYPMPMPIPTPNWALRTGAGGELIVDTRIMSTDYGARWSLRLRGGKQFARNIALIRSVISGVARKAELSIIEQRAHESDNRPNGTKSQSRLMLKMCIWIPRPPAKERNGRLIVATTEKALWAYRVADGDPRFFFADHVKRWIAERDRRKARTSHDMKYEKRWTRGEMQKMVGAREPWLEKHDNRMSSFIHESTAMLVGIADRSMVSEVVYNDDIKSFAPTFPWFMIKEKLKYKLEEKGIKFLVVEPMKEPIDKKAKKVEIIDDEAEVEIKKKSCAICGAECERLTCVDCAAHVVGRLDSVDKHMRVVDSEQKKDRKKLAKDLKKIEEIV